MTAKDIQRRLVLDRYRQSVCMPNYTPRNWFESDVWELTKARYFVEYEIKMSRSDFKADAQKHSRTWRYNDELKKFEDSSRNKHRAIANKEGPSRFYFVTPEGLIQPQEIPSWAGLIYAHERTKVRIPWNIVLTIVVRAPNIHRKKVEETTDHLSASYYRYIGLFLKL